MERSTKKMLEVKKRLGQKVVIADSNGNPMEVSATEALRIINSSNKRASCKN